MKRTLGVVGGHQLGPHIGVQLFVELLKTALLSLQNRTVEKSSEMGK